MKPLNKTLLEIRDEYSTIAGAWNGKDEIFYPDGPEGGTYTEHHAHAAGDIVEKTRELEAMLNDFNDF